MLTFALGVIAVYVIGLGVRGLLEWVTYQLEELRAPS